MAMSCRPDLIIFDEPTTALDVTTQVEVLAAMRDIVEQFNTAAIYITHDLAVVAQMAHRIMVLRYGKLVEEAPTRDDARLARARTTPRRCGRCASSPGRSGQATTSSCASTTSTPPTAGVVKVLDDVTRPGAARAHGGGGRRIGIRQVDAGARHHRPAAAAQGRDLSSTASRCRRCAGEPRQGAPAPHPDDLSDPRHRAQSAPEGARRHRPAARVLSRPQGPGAGPPHRRVAAS